MVRLCAYCNRRDPEIDTEVLLDIITAPEYQGVARHLQEVDRQWLPALIHRQLGCLPGLRRARG